MLARQKQGPLVKGWQADSGAVVRVQHVSQPTVAPGQAGKLCAVGIAPFVQACTGHSLEQAV